MKQHDAFKNRLPITEVRGTIVEFLRDKKMINVAIAGQGELPIIDSIDYFYCNGEHIAVVPPMSKLAKFLDDGSKFSAFVQEGFGKGAKKFYAEFSCVCMTGAEKVIDELAKTNHMIAKMKSHNAKFLKLHMEKGLISFSHGEIYDIGDDLHPTFAKFAPNGRARFAHSRQVLMTYLDRDVIFSVIIEDGVYYCLAKADSFKMEHIKNGGICKIYDGRDCHFETVIDIVDDKKDEIFAKLVATNNAYFKENQGLVALSFAKGG